MKVMNPETGQVEESEEDSEAGPSKLGDLFRASIAGPTFSITAAPASTVPTDVPSASTSLATEGGRTPHALEGIFGTPLPAATLPDYGSPQGSYYAGEYGAEWVPGPGEWIWDTGGGGEGGGSYGPHWSIKGGSGDNPVAVSPRDPLDPDQRRIANWEAPFDVGPKFSDAIEWAERGAYGKFGSPDNPLYFVPQRSGGGFTVPASDNDGYGMMHPELYQYGRPATWHGAGPSGGDYGLDNMQSEGDVRGYIFDRDISSAYIDKALPQRRSEGNFIKGALKGAVHAFWPWLMGLGALFAAPAGGAAVGATEGAVAAGTTAGAGVGAGLGAADLLGGAGTLALDTTAAAGGGAFLPPAAAPWVGTSAAGGGTLSTLRDIYQQSKPVRDVYKLAQFAKKPSVAGALNLLGTHGGDIANFASENLGDMFNGLNYSDVTTPMSELMPEGMSYEDIVSPPPMEGEGIESIDPDTGEAHLSDTADLSRLSGNVTTSDEAIRNIGESLQGTQYDPYIMGDESLPPLGEDDLLLEEDDMAWDDDWNFGGMEGGGGDYQYTGGGLGSLFQQPESPMPMQMEPYELPGPSLSGGEDAGAYGRGEYGTGLPQAGYIPAGGDFNMKNFPIGGLAKVAAGLYGNQQNKKLANNFATQAMQNTTQGMENAINSPATQTLMNRADPLQNQVMRTTAADDVTKSYADPWGNPLMQAARRKIMESARRGGAARGVNPLHTNLAAQSALSDAVFKGRDNSARIAGQPHGIEAARIGAQLGQMGGSRGIDAAMQQAQLRKSATDNLTAAGPGMGELAKWLRGRVFQGQDEYDWSSLGLGR